MTDAGSTDARVPAQGGSWPYGLFSYEVTCPAGSHISTFSGRSGDVADAIGPFTCTKGHTLPSLIGGSTGGEAWTHTAGTAGYTGVTVRAGTLIDEITLSGSFGSSSYGRPGGEHVGVLQCPPNMVVAGVFGQQTTTNPITIGLICRTPAPGEYCSCKITESCAIPQDCRWCVTTGNRISAVIEAWSEKIAATMRTFQQVTHSVCGFKKLGTHYIDQINSTVGKRTRGVPLCS
jgi:hypothetical protein